MKNVRIIILWLLVILLLVLADYFRSVSLQERGFSPEQEMLYRLPPAELMNVLALGFSPVVADYLWIKLILKTGQSLVLEGYQEHLEAEHAGGEHAHGVAFVPDWKDSVIVHYLEKNLEPVFFHYLDRITDLDPQFAYPYITGFTFELFHFKNREKSKYFLQKGMRNLPDYWEFPFYYGFIAYFYEQQPDSVVIPYLVRSVNATKGARVFNPDYPKTMLQAFLHKLSREKISYFYIQGLLESIGDEQLKNQMIQYFKQLQDSQSVRY